MAAFSEHKVKLADVGTKQYNVMRFKHPHRCDLSDFINPTLERQEVHTVEEEPPPEYGEGSEYGKKRKEEARRRRRGLMSKKAHPDDQPWVLKEQKKGGKKFVGRKEGGIDQNSSYFVLMLKENGDYEAYPISNWYDFAPPIKYKYLNDEEAEAQFERRNKTLNLFSVMMNKRIKDKEEEMSTGLPSSTADRSNESGSGSEMSGESLDEDERSHGTRRKVRKRRPSQHRKASEDEQGEDTDEGEMESREVDYFTDTSSDSEDERVKQAVKEEPRDDAEVERKEEAAIDQAFAEASSSEEDEELTEKGKELKALMQRQLEGEKEEEEEEEGEDDSYSSPEKEAFKKPEKKRPPSPVKGGDVSGGMLGKTRLPQKREVEAPSEATPTLSAQVPPPPKKPRLAEPTVDPNVITKEEVQKYLSRKPITSKQLVKKFVKLKPAMDKQKIVAVLGKILQTMPNIEKRELEGKLHLSICPEQEQS